MTLPVVVVTLGVPIVSFLPAIVAAFIFKATLLNKLNALSVIVARNHSTEAR